MDLESNSRRHDQSCVVNPNNSREMNHLEIFGSDDDILLPTQTKSLYSSQHFDPYQRETFIASPSLTS